MANGTAPPFYQEVLDALAQNNDERLVLLADLCKAVDTKIALAAADAARPLDLVRFGLKCEFWRRPRPFVSKIAGVACLQRLDVQI